ncbi:MAG: type IV pilus twitching motility protein PilT [Verrucomicrobia bacterium]|jgi:twitching motility protein PilT|nr:type IV pilus twitching motility protein PilT [Verrucomicrobiota bacterium]
MAYEMNQLLEAMIENGASDLHIRVGRSPSLRVNGDIVSIDGPALTEADAKAMVISVVPPAQTARLDADGGCDFAFSFRNKTRLRVNAFRGLGGYGMVLRLLPSAMFTLEQLRLPPVIKDMLKRARGLVLVTGPTGSGKSTTLASMINWINENEQGHIITIEDPIEYTHAHKNCLVTQREVGVDLPSFSEGVRAALRQDPDVILIGEMRDLETIEAAVTAAETGHLVLGTLHTSGATRTIDRIIDAFPASARDQIRAQLSTSLSAVISQCLLHTTDDKRVAAFEVMVRTDGIGAKIREGKTYQLLTDIETGGARGMRTLDSDLLALFFQGTVSEEEVFNYCQNPEAMRERMRGGAAAR